MATRETSELDILNDIDIFSELSEKKIQFEQENIEQKTPALEHLGQDTEAQLFGTTQLHIFHTLWNYVKFILQFLGTSTVIFMILLVTTNYSAYLTLVNSYLFKEELEKSNDSIITSVEASSIVMKEQEKKLFERKTTDIVEKKVSQHSIKQLMTQSNKEDTPLNVEITPFENRIVIPKIGKNIPLLDVANKTVDSQHELQQVFMTELQNGVIRYPGSAKPGDEGNTFIFGHSSNFPWIKGDYNDVFALLDKVVYDDVILVYYNQKKYTFKIREKAVVYPGDTSIIKKDSKKSEITLMTCWPVGTTLKRLVLVGELVDNNTELEKNDKKIAMK